MSLRHAMLGLVARGPASGYDLLRIFGESLAHVWPATQSQLYTELGRLTEAGLVAMTAEGPRGRKEYAITDAGLAELRHWLVEVAPEPPRRNEALLRVFFLGRLSDAEARAYFEARARAADDAHRALTLLAERIADDPGDLALNGRLVAEYGIRLARTNREWAEWAAGQIAARAEAEGGSGSRSGTDGG